MGINSMNVEREVTKILPTSHKKAHHCDFRVWSFSFRRAELFLGFYRLKAELQTRMGSRALIDLIATLSFATQALRGWHKKIRQIVESLEYPSCKEGGAL